MRRWSGPLRCPGCGGDPHDADHARGCPMLEPFSKEKLLRMALQAEEGWRKLNRKRSIGMSENKVKAAGA